MLENHKGKIWIDLDNSPHVPFFRPIMEQLRGRGYEIILTARDSFQTCGLADLYGMNYKRIGKHFGKNTILKVLGLVIRAMQLVPTALKEKPTLALSHGSRAQLLTAFLLRIPSVVISDYEYTIKILNPTWEIMPEVINKDKLSKKRNIINYPGIKEDVYVPDFMPAADIRQDFGISEDEYVITVRPPATEAHYYNPESEKLFEATIEILCNKENTRIIMLPRNNRQKNMINNKWPQWCLAKKIIIPEQVLDGLNLIWYSDFVISGGGTMNREAAALRVPVYSVFRGKIGDVDRYLSEHGLLTLLESVNDVHTKIMIVKRQRQKTPMDVNNKALTTIVNEIISIMDRIN